jgi:hypothetical protein
VGKDVMAKEVLAAIAAGNQESRMP